MLAAAFLSHGRDERLSLLVRPLGPHSSSERLLFPGLLLLALQQGRSSLVREADEAKAAGVPVQSKPPADMLTKDILLLCQVA